MKTIYRLAVLMIISMALLAISIPAQAYSLDSRIESTARKSYVFKTFLMNDDIKIESKDGEVTLTGVVADDFNKSLAEETMAGIPGVKSVDNKLEIKGEPPTANSDAWIRDKVKVTLMFHRSVYASTTDVSVKDGIVTLGGYAANQAQKELTTEYAKDVEGVKDVVNDMVVSTRSKKKATVGNKIDDASITAQVKMTLLFHRSTSAVNTKVETKRGVVTLYGKAGNVAEKDLVSKLASDVNGVETVTNRMTVE
jgi:osmotically-inducible protein OsmY